MLLGNPDRLSDIAIFAVFMFYGLAFFAVFILRKKGIAKNASYKVPLYPITPIVAVIGAVYIVGSTLINTPKDTLMSIVIAVIGIPIYAVLKSKSQKKPLPKAS
jgi:APA family basic amino acid/polyamine antiporter